MNEARGRLASFTAGRDDGIARAQPEGDDNPLTTPPVDLGEPEPEQPKLEPAAEPRLGDRRPEFRDLSEKVAEANRMTRDYGGLR